jgi:hypothetical protein
MRREVENHVQKSCPENDKKANSLALRELYVPYHVHGKDKNVDIGHSARKTMDKECDLGIPAGSAGRIPIRGYRVALLNHLLIFSSSLVFVFGKCIGEVLGGEREGNLQI